MQCRGSTPRKAGRRGAALLLSVVMIALVLGVIALAVDGGYLMLVRTQLQVAADSSAMAGAAELMDSEAGVVAMAQQYASRHVAANRHVALSADDVELGRWDFRTRRFDPAAWTANAVEVTARRDASSGGGARLFFAALFGIESLGVRSQAVAAFVDNFHGFRVPPDEKSLPILPLALKKETCDAMLRGEGSDLWSWDADSRELRPGCDHLAEVSLYPQATGSPGNFGTVDIGRPQNSASDLARQILHGVTAEDLSYHGGSLSLDEGGVLELGGDPGITASVQDALVAIKGQPRIVPVYDQVTGTGNTARFRIVGFVGVRIMDVKLTGAMRQKRLTVQPARVIVRGGIPAPDDAIRSRGIFSPVCLVR